MAGVPAEPERHDAALRRGALVKAIGLVGKLLYPVLIVVLTRLFGAETMGRYLLAHLERSEGYLPQALWDRAHAPVGEERYGFGWGALPDGSFAHDGSNGLWYCHMRIWPERGRAYAAFANEARSDTARWMAEAGSALAET